MKCDGTFKNCTNCKKSINCCQEFNKLNAPSISIEEKELINKYYSNFYDELEKNIFTLKTKNNTCIFFKNNNCSIYNIRPLDCRLYPYDIIEKEEKYFLILYKLNCINENIFLNNMNEINSLIEKIKPWIKDFTNKSNFSKMINQEYVILREILI